ncbi:MAG TPA: hypothetical protein VFS23_06890 [Vicinamibacterales bacterium]|nr:hypothetical protein [Vicinamibacterales bacterium]
MRWDLKAFAACLTDEVIVDANQVILRLAEEYPVTLVGARWDLRLLGAPQPLD